MKKSKKPSKPAAPTTKTALAQALGISRQALNRHASKPDAPPIDDLAAWDLYLAAEGREGTGHLRERISEQRLKFMTAAAEREQIRLNKDKAAFIPKDTLAFVLARGTGALFSALDRYANVDWPVNLKGLDQAGICARVKSDIETIKNNFRAELQALLADPQGPATAARVGPDDSAQQQRRLFDLRVSAEAKWRSCTDPVEKARLWHEELNPLWFPQPEAAQTAQSQTQTPHIL